MNYLVLPVACSLALASMSAAVVSHWWSVEMFAASVGNLPRTQPNSPAPPPTSRPLVAPPAATASLPPAAQPSPAQKEFFEAMLDEMKLIRKENTALRDQMAETNRDMMKLEFRVDTHSASFRPLPTTETEPNLDAPMIDDGPGVLPPPREVVGLPLAE